MKVEDIRNIIKKQGLTYRDVARMTGYKPNTVHSYITAKQPLTKPFEKKINAVFRNHKYAATTSPATETETSKATSVSNVTEHMFLEVFKSNLSDSTKRFIIFELMR